MQKILVVSFLRLKRVMKCPIFGLKCCCTAVQRIRRVGADRTLETEYNDRDIGIFADAGDYEGLNLDDDDEAEENSTSQQKDEKVTDKPLRSWFLEDTSLHPEAEEQPQHSAKTKSSQGSNIEDTLTKGAVKHQGEQEERKAKKERRKAGGGNKGKDVDAKIIRDCQKLKSYTEKKEKKLQLLLFHAFMR